MTAKQYLNRVRRIDKEIEQLEERKKKAKEKLLSMTQNYNSDGTQSTKNPHKFDSIVELQDLIDEYIDKQYAIKCEVQKTIMKIPDRRQRMVLSAYYIDMKTWEQVAVDLNYSYMHITRIHGYALKEVQKVLESGI